MDRHSFYIRIAVGSVWNAFRCMLATGKAPFLAFVLALLNQELKQESITYT